jgi:hypothetical protein
MFAKFQEVPVSFFVAPDCAYQLGFHYVDFLGILYWAIYVKAKVCFM